MTADWLVFVDETGNFERDEYAAIVGVVVNANDPATRKALDAARNELDNLLHSLWPGLTYPPHAAELRRPSAFLAAWMLAGEDATHEHANALTALAAEVRRPNTSLGRFATNIERQLKKPSALRMLPFTEDLRRADSLLRGRPGYDVLERAAERWSEAYRRLVDRIGKTACFVVAAADRVDSPVSDEARYLRLLVSLFERCLQFLRRRHGSGALIDLTVAGRDFNQNQENHRRLSWPDVEAAFQKARAFPLFAANDRIRIMGKVKSYGDSDVPLGLILADTAANCLLSRLKSRAWATLRSDFGQQARMQIESYARGFDDRTALPGAAFHGGLQELIGRACGQDVGAPADVGAPGWAIEQARVWIAATREALRSKASA